MTLYIKSQLADLLVNAAQERSLADTVYLINLIREGDVDSWNSIIADVYGRLILEDADTYRWLAVDVFNCDKTDEEKAAIAEQINDGQLGIYRIRNSAGGS